MKNNKFINTFLLVAVLVLSAAAFLYHDHLNNNDTGTNLNENSAVVEQPGEKPTPGPEDSKNAVHDYSVITYGYSGKEVPLSAHKFTSDDADRKILCVFAIHGFEDAFYRDGQLLVDTAEEIIEHYRKDSKALGSYDLIIVPEANPDGVREGWTCNGPGRCQISQGIDINMDFDYNFRVRTNARNKTGNEPFASPEAAALRDLVKSENPDIIIDFHGWINCAAGDSDLAEVFCKHLGLVHQTKEQAIYDGFFVGWAAKFSKAVLVEYPNPLTGQGEFEGKSNQRYDYVSSEFSDLGYAEKTIKALEEIAEKAF